MRRTAGRYKTGAPRPIRAGTRIAGSAARPRLARKGAPPRRGFVSKKQWRWAYVNRMPWAGRITDETKGGPRVRYRRLPTWKV